MNSTLQDRIQYIILLVICLFLIVYNFLEWKFLGFPDGHLTELDQAQVTLLPIFSFGYFVLLLRGIIQLIKSNINLKQLRSWVFILVAVQFVLGYILSQILEHGQGG